MTFFPASLRSRIRALAAFAVAGALLPAAQAQAAVTVVESGIWGGGLINAIARDPNNPERFIIGGDVSGYHVSKDAGVTWTTSNRGLLDPQQDTVAAVAFRRAAQPGHKDVFGAYGAAGGGLVLSPNGGSNWVAFGPDASQGGPAFQGHDACGRGPYPDPCSDPRPTGTLIVLDESSGPPPVLRFVYVGTFGRGIMRTDATGSSWTTIALGSGTSFCSWGDPPEPGCYVTSLVRDPRRRNVLYVGTHGNGAFRIASTDCVGDGCAEANVTPILAAPGSDPIEDAEELWFQATGSGTQLTCACGKQGFYRGLAPFTSLEQSNTGLAFDTTVGFETSYTAISGSSADAVSPIYLANQNSLCEIPEGRVFEECHSVYRSQDGGSTWEDVVFDQNVQKTVLGTTIDWWEFLCCRNQMLNQESYLATSIVLTADDPAAVLVAGRSGVWKTTAEGDTFWQPAVQGIGATTEADVVTDPKDADRVYLVSADWTLFASASILDPGTTVQTEPAKVFTNGYALAVDRQVAEPISLAYLAAGSLDIGVGAVHTSTDPTQPGTNPWISLGFTTTGCDRSTPRIIGVGVGRFSAITDPFTLAATDGCGMWRFDGTSWQLVSPGSDMFTIEDLNMRYAPISFPNNIGRLVFAFDRKTGKLWESNNLGSSGSWVKVWQVPAGEEVDAHSGFMIADPNELGIVWVTTGAVDGLHQLSCPVPPVLNGCVDLMVPPTEVHNPGPIAIRPCAGACTSTIYLATRTDPDDPTLPVLFKHTSGGGDWCNLTAAAPLYERAANSPAQVAASLEVSGVTTVYLTMTGQGVLVISDDTGDCLPSGEPAPDRRPR